MSGSKDIRIKFADTSKSLFLSIRDHALVSSPDNPLGSDHYTTFHKPDDDKSTALVSNHSVPSVVEEEASLLTSNPPLETSLDIGTRLSSHAGRCGLPPHVTALPHIYSYVII